MVKIGGKFTGAWFLPPAADWLPGPTVIVGVELGEFASLPGFPDAADGEVFSLDEADEPPEEVDVSALDDVDAAGSEPTPFGFASFDEPEEPVAEPG